MEFDRARDRGGDSEIRLRKVGGNSARCLATLNAGDAHTGPDVPDTPEIGLRIPGAFRM